MVEMETPKRHCNLGGGFLKWWEKTPVCHLVSGPTTYSSGRKQVDKRLKQAPKWENKLTNRLCYRHPKNCRLTFDKLNRMMFIINGGLA
jgi:hypothetical protein